LEAPILTTTTFSVEADREYQNELFQQKEMLLALQEYEQNLMKAGVNTEASTKDS
jgi:hypothetical protein